MSTQPTNPIRDLKQVRADLDVLLSLGNNLRDSRETSVAFTKAQEGKMHVGNTLFELEQAYLYKESMNASNDKIEKYHVDEEITPMATPADWNTGTHVANVKIMRRELDAIQKRLKGIAKSPDFLHAAYLEGKESEYAILFLQESLVRLRESQNWFGMELGRLLKSQVG